MPAAINMPITTKFQSGVGDSVRVLAGKPCSCYPAVAPDVTASGETYAEVAIDQAHTCGKLVTCAGLARASRLAVAIPSGSGHAHRTLTEGFPSPASRAHPVAPVISSRRAGLRPTIDKCVQKNSTQLNVWFEPHQALAPIIEIVFALGTAQPTAIRRILVRD